MKPPEYNYLPPEQARAEIKRLESKPAGPQVPIDWQKVENAISLFGKHGLNNAPEICRAYFTLKAEVERLEKGLKHEAYLKYLEEFDHSARQGLRDALAEVEVGLNAALIDQVRSATRAEKAEATLAEVEKERDGLLSRIVHQVYLMSLRGVGDDQLGGFMAEARAILARRKEQR